jgi:hypothetical protein
MTKNVTEFPVIKDLNGEEALSIAGRLGAKKGVVIFECPCGCGKIKVIDIGEPSHRDMLFYAEHLKGYSVNEYCDILSVIDCEIS